MKTLLIILVYIFAVLVVYHTLVRIIRHFYKFPIPAFLTKIIDSPLRHKMQSPYEAACRHGIESGMKVLEVGPGGATYTFAAGKVVGECGHITTIDISEKVISSVKQQIEINNIANITPMVADVYALPFDDNSFDLIYMIAVIGEIPDVDRAIKELYRVLKADGILAFSEFFVDPDYPLEKRLIKRVIKHGFLLEKKLGNFFYYTLRFKKK